MWKLSVGHKLFVEFDKQLYQNKKRNISKGRDKMNRISNTQFFQVENGPQIQAKDLLEIVYQALREKGYNPVSQMVGYLFE